MKKAIVIPIYLRLNYPEEVSSSEGVILAKRAIQSLRLLKDQDFTLILPVCFDLTGGGDEGAFAGMDTILRKEFGGLREGKTFLFSSRHLRPLREYMAQGDFRDLPLLLDLKGFSKIRNTGLLLALALSMDAVIFIDNDEVVEDPHYLKIACDYLNQRWNGKLIGGKGGFYLNPDDGILLPSPNLWWRVLWDKTKWMNRVWENILASKDRLVHSPMLLGGNLVLHRHVFSKIPFDPYIPRGEDTDYLINASQMGFCILFDKELKIKHLHPQRTDVYFHEELRLDIERFLYERDKVRRGIGISLDPYPGYFLKRTLYPKALFTSLLLAVDYLRKREWKKGLECIDLLRFLFRKRDRTWLKYLTFCADWEKAMEKIREERPDKLLEQSWVE
jgi:hypothetical protein